MIITKEDHAVDKAYHFYLLSGVELDFDSFDLGQGVSLSRTYVHLMGHPVLAFAPAKEGKPSPAPWRTVVVHEEGVAVDLLAELAVPEVPAAQRIDLTQQPKGVLQQEQGGFVYLFSPADLLSTAPLRLVEVAKDQ